MEAQPGVVSVPKLFSGVAVKRYWPLMVMTLLMLLCWVPYFLAKPQQPLVFLAWGNSHTKIYATVKTAELVGKRPDRLMMIARIADNSVPYETDKQIARSATFEIGDEATSLEINSSPDVIATLSKPGAVLLYILQVPKDFPFELVRSISDAQKLGAKVLGITGFSFASK
jgi:hypothetical protein